MSPKQRSVRYHIRSHSIFISRLSIVAACALLTRQIGFEDVGVRGLLPVHLRVGDGGNIASEAGMIGEGGERPSCGSGGEEEGIGEESVEGILSVVAEAMAESEAGERHGGDQRAKGKGFNRSKSGEFNRLQAANGCFLAGLRGRERETEGKGSYVCGRLWQRKH
jgi:hypothetical protein